MLKKQTEVNLTQIAERSALYIFKLTPQLLFSDHCVAVTAQSTLTSRCPQVFTDIRKTPEVCSPADHISGSVLTLKTYLHIEEMVVY